MMRDKYDRAGTALARMLPALVGSPVWAGSVAGGDSCIERRAANGREAEVNRRIAAHVFMSFSVKHHDAHSLRTAHGSRVCLVRGARLRAHAMPVQRRSSSRFRVSTS